MDIRSQSPDANVIFYPFETEDTEKNGRNRIDIRTTEVVAHDHILELQTNKPKTGTGTFSVMLSSAVNWKGILHPGCWCIIYMSDQRLTGEENGEEDSGLKMLGIVRSVRRAEQTDPSTGKKTLRYLVAGEDFHSVLTIPIYINQHLTQTSQGNTLPSGLFLFGKLWKAFIRPNEVVKALVDSLLGRPAFILDKGNNSNVVQNVPLLNRTGIPYRMPEQVARRIFGGRRAASNFFTGLLTFFFQQDLIGEYFNKTEVPPGTHSLWSIMLSYSNRLLNELYTDLLPVSVFGKNILLPSLVLRSIPFSSPEAKNTIRKNGLISMQEAGGEPNKTAKRPATRRSGIALNSRARGKRKKSVGPGRGAHFYVSRVITESEIFSLNSGKSDRERFNFFLISPNIAQGQVGEAAVTLALLNNPDTAVDKNSLARYGLRPYITQSNFIPTGSTNTNFLELNRICEDLWGRAYLFESGQVLLTGSKDFIPVGTNIQFIERDWLAHVEAVNNTYAVDSTSGVKTFRTQISFVRLQTLSGEPIEAVDKLENIDEVKLSTSERIFRGETFVEIDKAGKKPRSKGTGVKI